MNARIGQTERDIPGFRAKVRYLLFIVIDHLGGRGTSCCMPQK